MTSSTITTMPTIELKPSLNLVSAEERERILAAPGFGRFFTDHMVMIKWTEGVGWHDAELVPYAPLSIDPANMTLHYAQTIFEGLKAYRQADGSVALFRPEENARRFQRSARRMAMPELPVETFIAAVEALVGQDQAWVPAQRRGHAVSAPVHVRDRGRRRGPAGQRVPLHGHRLARRRLLHRWRAAGLRLAVRGVCARRPRRYGRGEGRR